MKSYSYIAAILAAFLFNTACSQKNLSNRPAFSPEGFPRMVYVDDEVQKLKTSVDIPSHRPVYVEVRTKEGHQRAGKLLRITEIEVVLHEAVYRKTAGDGFRIIESKIAVPKQEVLIMKIW
jgi:hypothetical protein